VYDDVVVDDAPYARWADFIDARFATSSPPVRRVLDVCCGTGILTAQLVARGYQLRGVDASAAMLQVARERLGPRVPLVESVLPDLAVEDAVDAAVSTFDGLNYLPPSDLAASLAAVARVVVPHGWLVFDLHTEAMMRFTADHPVATGRSHAGAFEVSTAVDLDARRCLTRVELSSDAGSFVEVHRQYFHTDTEVRAALAESGWTEVTATADYTDAAVAPTDLRATWVARRTA